MTTIQNVIGLLIGNDARLWCGKTIRPWSVNINRPWFGKKDYVSEKSFDYGAGMSTDYGEETSIDYGSEMSLDHGAEVDRLRCGKVFDRGYTPCEPSQGGAMARAMTRMWIGGCSQSTLSLLSVWPSLGELPLRSSERSPASMARGAVETTPPCFPAGVCQTHIPLQ